MDADTAIRLGCLVVCAVIAGAYAYSVYDRHVTYVAVRDSHSEMVRIATEQDIARRLGD